MNNSMHNLSFAQAEEVFRLVLLEAELYGPFTKGQPTSDGWYIVRHKEPDIQARYVSVRWWNGKHWSIPSDIKHAMYEKSLDIRARVEGGIKVQEFIPSDHTAKRIDMFAKATYQFGR